MTIDHFRQLLTYEWWAIEQVHNALTHLPEIPERAGEIFMHILRAHEIWYLRVTGQPVHLPLHPEPFEPRRSEVTQRRIQQNWEEFFSHLSEEDLSRPIAYQNSKGQSFENPMRDILQHLFLHSAYHRGQIALLLRMSKHHPPATDYILYVRS
ncbi:MAG: damage-inducible protein DinB [Calditrichaeota bacterium]|nr:damage-inducible protein DinB [Calditrichota bacterium]